VLLHRDAAGDPGLVRPDLHDRRPAVGQLDPHDLRQVPSPEQHRCQARAQHLLARRGQRRIIEHTIIVAWLVGEIPRFVRPE